MNIDSIIGTINNTVTEYMDASGLVVGQGIVYDIPYLVRAIIFIMTLSFAFKLILALIRRI